MCLQASLPVPGSVARFGEFVGFDPARKEDLVDGSRQIRAVRRYNIDFEELEIGGLDELGVVRYYWRVVVLAEIGGKRPLAGAYHQLSVPTGQT